MFASTSLFFLMALSCHEASLQNTAESMIKAKTRRSIASAPFGALSAAQFIANLDQYALCITHIIGKTAEADFEVYNGSTQHGLSQDVENYLKDVTTCKFIDDLVKHWPSGCAYFFDALLLGDQYAMCVVALSCRKDAQSPDYIHGACLNRCENKATHTGNVTTICDEAPIVAAGLTHPQVCADEIPINILYDYQSWLESLFSSVIALVYVTLEVGLKLIPGLRGSFMPGYGALINGYFQMIVMAHIMYSAFNVMRSARGLCNFMIMASAPQFGPFAFSYSIVMSMFLRVCGAFGLISKAKLERGPEAWNAVCKLFLSLPLAIFWMVVSIVECVFILCVFIPAFWGIFAYILIFLVMLVAFLVQCYCMGAFAMACVEWHELDEEDDYDVGHFVFFLFTPIVAQLLASMSLLFGSSFLLYRTGDWHAFHDSFWGDFNFSLPVFPSFHLVFNPTHFYETLVDVITFARIPMFATFEFAVSFTFWSFVFEKIIQAIWFCIWYGIEYGNQD